MAWLFYYLKKDLHPEPKKMILKVFLYGALITIPALLIQIALAKLLTQIQYNDFFKTFPIAIEAVKWFIVIALTEELLKYFVVKWTILKNKELDEPLDIMLYMVVAALGFSALENILYLFTPAYNMSFSTIITTTVVISFIRFIGATFLHTLCSALLGYFLALSFFKTRQRLPLTVIGILLAVLLHGLYDFSIMTLDAPMNFILPIIIVLALALFMVYDFDEIKKIKSICKI